MRQIRVFIRKFRNNLRYYLLMTLGSGLALSAILFIMSYVSTELLYNKFTNQSENIFRIVMSSERNSYESSETFGPQSHLLIEKSPYVSDGFRYLSELYEFQIGEQIISENTIFTDESFFHLLELTFIYGSSDKFKNTPNGVVVSKKFAQTYYKSENPIGKNIQGASPFEEKENFTIVGVVEEIPENSTIQGNLFLNLSLIDKKAKYNPWVYTYENYIKISHLNDIDFVKSSISEILKTELESLDMKGFADGYSFRLQQFEDIYLHSGEIKDRTIKGNFRLIKILIGIGMLIIGLFVFNYLIISSGMLLKHSDAFRTMRCFGVSNNDLRKQLIVESILSMSVSFLFSIIVYAVIVNLLADFLKISIDFSINNQFLLGFLFILIIIAIITGENLNQFLKRILSRRIKTTKFSTKSVLTTIQLSIFILLSISMISISKQISFMQNTDLGYNLENTVVVTAYNKKQRELLYNDFSKKSYVNSVAFGQGIYGSKPELGTFSIEDTDTEIKSIVRLADHNYLKTFDIKLVEGRNIKYTEIEYGNEKERSKVITEVLVNKEFVKRAGLDNPLGTIIKDKDGMMVGEIIGVINNLQQSAFYEPVEPIVLGNMPYHQTYVILNLADGSFNSFLKDFKSYCKSVNMELYMDMLYSYKSKSEIFAKEIVLFRLLIVSFVIAIIIMCLGLLSTSLFITEQQTKEIGIRKVNGARTLEILTLLNKDFIKWVAIAFVVATPVAYYAMNKWLENFAYKTSLSWWIFALAGLLALGIAILTVSWQSWRAATRNPVESLRYE